MNTIEVVMKSNVTYIQNYPTMGIWSNFKTLSTVISLKERWIVLVS